MPSMQTAPVETSAGPQAAAKVYRCGTLSYSLRGLVALFAWMLWGDFCFTLMEAVVPSILPLKLHSLNSPNTLISVIMTTLPGAFNILVTPFISFQSDRHRGKRGRRLPYITYTVPFLTLSLVLIAFDDSLAAWVRTHLAGGTLSQTTVVIILLAIFAAMFDFFNMFVYTVYWYLFNDVVPQEWMGRFMSWFKLVGVVAGALYNFFIFKYAETHMRAIYLGAAAIYFIGFGLMCLRTKEGKYPPVPAEEKRQPVLEKFKTFGRECYTMRYYWDIYLSLAVYAMAGCVGVFNIFFMRSLGLDNNLYGKLGGVGGVTIPICLLFAGSLVDKWNAVRVSAYWSAFLAFHAFGGWIWLFVDKPNPMLLFWTGALHTALFGSLFMAINSVTDLPRVMALFPKERFGQFSGAIAMLRAPAVMVGGLLAGLFMDLFKHLFPVGEFSYRFNFLWSGPLTVLGFYFHYRVYRAWKRLGGEKGYVAPSKPFKLSELKPYPGDEGQVLRGPIIIFVIYFIGGLLGGLTWWIYYTFFHVNHFYATLFLISLPIGCILLFLNLRFIKFMERP